jgi:predicted TIM-barrel fold metal-dependent hydrolase
VIIDFHTHVGEREHYFGSFASDLQRSWADVRWEGRTLDEHRAAVQNVDRAVVLAFDAPASGFVVPNDYVAEYVAEQPDKLIGFASVDPNRPDAHDRLDQAILGLGLRGVKLGPIYQHFDPTSPAAIEFFQHIERLDVPVLIHQGTTFVRDAPLRHARPWLLDEVATACPDLRMWIAHLGHPWCDETMVVLRKHPNLYADVSALHTRPVQLYQALNAAVEYRVTDKLLLGSDYPFSTIEETLQAVRDVNAVVAGSGFPPIPDDVIDGIVHGERHLAALGLG